MKYLRRNRLGILVITLGLAFAYLGCSNVRLISDYDELTDQKVNELQAKVTHHFVKLARVVGTEDANYEKFVEFYDEARVDLSIIEIRAKAIPKNDIIVKQIALMKQNISDFEQLHKIGFKSIQEITPIENAFNSAFTAIIKLLMALKRGEE